jgi:hypothetical protein
MGSRLIPIGIMENNQKDEVELLRQEIARLKSGASNSGFVQVSRKHIDGLNQLALQSPKAHLSSGNSFRR